MWQSIKDFLRRIWNAFDIFGVSYYKNKLYLLSIERKGFEEDRRKLEQDWERVMQDLYDVIGVPNEENTIKISEKNLINIVINSLRNRKENLMSDDLIEDDDGKLYLDTGVYRWSNGSLNDVKEDRSADENE
jgi:hypothetical protein